jgi:predicted glycogen debranching enzyme
MFWSGGAEREQDEGGSWLKPLLTREWLVTNGLGGFAAGSIAGVVTRRHHGILVAALPAPLGRVVMLSQVGEQVQLDDDTTHCLGGEEHRGGLRLPGAEYLTEFRLEDGLPVWRFRVDGSVIEKRLLLVHHQNTVHLSYARLEGAGPVRLQLRPALHFWPQEGAHGVPLEERYTVTAVENRYEIGDRSDLSPLRLRMVGGRAGFTVDGRKQEVLYRVEASRGYEATGELWSPGYFSAELIEGSGVTLIASTESWEMIGALRPTEALIAETERRRRLIEAAPPAAREGPAAELVLAADQFIITPAGRVEDAARAQAEGDDARTVIAGYHWFTDWGRDTMISLEGLTLGTGRAVEAGYILRTFGQYIRDGLIPNLFPEGEKEGLYHTADATLWFFQATHRYLAATGDRETLRLLLPKLVEIVEWHRRGTHFGIGLDPTDGLLRQGAEGYQLTWMDAKVGDWVVTPRRGKAVEINALWFNALRLLEGWVRVEEGGEAAEPFGRLADQVGESFNARFWYEAGGYLYDVVDGEQGDDPACRPNQILAISLSHPVLDPARWGAVVETVRERLLTPVGLRSLAPGHPDYKPRYYGDLRARDAAYHQGTVWAWLIGPFVDAWLRVHPGDRSGARRLLDGLIAHLDEACIGSISEIFDAEPPYTPRGCVAQAWSVAETLRVWLKTAE